MSNIITYNDYVQINPDSRILSLDKAKKISIIDNMLERSDKDGKGLIITYDLSHSGRRINNRIYSTAGQQRGIDSLTSPYAKPILRNHDQSGEPIGRFIGGEWQSLHDEASFYLESGQKMLDIQSAFIDDDPGKIYDVLKKSNLLEDKKWPGLGRMRVQANITDEEAIKKFMDGRYLTFSAGSTTNRHVCSICETDWVKDGMCEHRHGKEYDGEICVFITGDFLVIEGSVVNTPADDLSQMVHMEVKDSFEEKKFSFDEKSTVEQILFTDSTYDFGEKNGIQAAKQVEDNDEEEEKEEVKFDHALFITEAAMEELHQKGETYITQKNENQSMVIKVEYSGNMRKDDFKEDSFSLFETEVNELIEELTDEKTFKVPAGAKGNAQKVLKWKKEKGSEVKGMTPVGWARARQLASKAEIGLSTVKRMAAFNRHRKNAAVDPKYKSEPWKDRGYVAWLGWGGTSGIDWAIKVSAANDSLNEKNQTSVKNDILISRNPTFIDTENLNIKLEKDLKSIDDFSLALEKLGKYNPNGISLWKNINDEKDNEMEAQENQISEEATPVEENIETDSETKKEEPTKAPPPVPAPEEEDETLDDSIQWEVLDLAFRGLSQKEGIALSEKERANLDEAFFCGPNKTLPIANHDHVELIKNLIDMVSISEASKEELVSIVDEKVKLLAPKKSDDYLELISKLNDLQLSYDELEDRFKKVLESILEKKEEKVDEKVEKDSNDEVIDNKVSVTDQKVESPSEHIKDEEISSSKKENNLPAFEQKIVVAYKEILANDGELAAYNYLSSQASYLPRGFDPNKF